MPDRSSPPRVLITGAYGLIGNLVYARLAKDRQPSARAAALEVYDIPAGRLRLADISDFGAVRRAVEGIDVVVHLAGDPDGKAAWESVLHNNIIGTHNVFEACRLAGVQRVIYGSTNQVVLGYGREAAYQPLLAGRWAEITPGALKRIDYTQPARPLSDYACSKVFGEALAHMYAYSHGLSCLCLRIGWVLGGAVTIEYVFARPGLGSLLIKALSQHDYPVVQACLLMLAVAVMLGTLLGDILQALMDPRVRSALK